MANFKQSELQYLENYRLLFTNLGEVGQLQLEMEEYGYGSEEIAEGKRLYDQARALYDQKQQETAGAKEAYAIFSKAYAEAVSNYNGYRKKAKVALMKHTEFWATFALKGSPSQAYLKWMKEARIFYEQMKMHAEARLLLDRFKLTESVAEEQLSTLEKVTALRAKYEKEKGESQQATKDKNKAFELISEWVRDFYAVAKVALEDHPQLLESIGKFVRS